MSSSKSPAKLSLTTLPPELFLNIIYQIDDLKDYLNLRRTNKRLHEFLKAEEQVNPVLKRHVEKLFRLKEYLKLRSSDENLKSFLEGEEKNNEELKGVLCRLFEKDKGIVNYITSDVKDGFRLSGKYAIVKLISINPVVGQPVWNEYDNFPGSIMCKLSVKYIYRKGQPTRFVEGIMTDGYHDGVWLMYTVKNDEKILLQTLYNSHITRLKRRVHQGIFTQFVSRVDPRIPTRRVYPEEDDVSSHSESEIEDDPADFY